MLFLRKNLSLGVHLLYALLCGRPVVVLAEPSNERSVARSVIHLHVYLKTREISCKQKVDKRKSENVVVLLQRHFLGSRQRKLSRDDKFEWVLFGVQAFGICNFVTTSSRRK